MATIWTLKLKVLLSNWPNNSKGKDKLIVALTMRLSVYAEKWSTMKENSIKKMVGSDTLLFASIRGKEIMLNKSLETDFTDNINCLICDLVFWKFRNRFLLHQFKFPTYLNRIFFFSFSSCSRFAKYSLLHKNVTCWLKIAVNSWQG